MSLHIEPVTPGLGARVTGLALADVSDDDLAGIQAAIADHKVLFFPDQRLAPAEHLAFARRMGEIDVAAFGPKHPDHPEMTVLDQTAPRDRAPTRGTPTTPTWHSRRHTRSCNR